MASLFRNFLLAERVLRSYDCTPVSHPALPPTYQHPMWQAWDLALDLSLSQLPGVLAKEETFVHLPFFEEQLTAFQVWLKLGKYFLLISINMFFKQNYFRRFGKQKSSRATSNSFTGVTEPST